MLQQFPDPPQSRNDLIWADTEQSSDAPSLPIILLGAVSGLSGGVIALYVSTRILGLNPPLAAGGVTFIMLALLGGSAAGLTVLTDSRAVIPNVGLSCGLLVLSLLFLGFCLFLGAIAATFVLTWGG